MDLASTNPLPRLTPRVCWRGLLLVRSLTSSAWGLRCPWGTDVLSLAARACTGKLRAYSERVCSRNGDGLRCDCSSWRSLERYASRQPELIALSQRRAPRAVRQRRKPVDAILNASPIVPGRCLRHPLPLAQHEIRDDILLAASLFVAPYAYNQHACAFGRRWCHRSDRTEPRD
eukprot:scaffold57442_cov70-Phaeocystis_antarctica.AAC.1